MYELPQYNARWSYRAIALFRNSFNFQMLFFISKTEEFGTYVYIYLSHSFLVFA